MNGRSVGIAMLCLALSACNSKSADQTAAPDEVTNPAAQTTEPKMSLPVEAQPAPEGLPSRIAREVIGASGQKCDGVAKADRNDQDGSITASCTGGENYRVYTLPGKGAVATAM